MREYKGLIFTNHALTRLKQRGISQGDAWATWRNADQSRYAKSKDAWIYYKTYGSSTIEVVAKYNEKKEWVVLSVWSKPVYKQKYKKSSGILASIKNLLGL